MASRSVAAGFANLGTCVVLDSDDEPVLLIDGKAQLCDTSDKPTRIASEQHDHCDDLSVLLHPDDTCTAVL